MIRAIIFDCFGVLAEDGWLPFKRRYIGENKQLADEVGDLGKQNEYGMMSNAEYLEKTSALIGVPAQQLQKAIGRQKPNEELFEYIASELKLKYKIGLLSNANYDVVHELFTQEQAKVFDATVLSVESRLIKPDPRMFELMCDRLGVEPEECIFVDDVERYCDAAGLFGMYAIHYKDPDQCRTEIETIIR